GGWGVGERGMGDEDGALTHRGLHAHVARGWLRFRAPASELLLDHVGDHDGIRVAHHDHRHVARDVPVRVVVVEVVGPYRLDGGLDADGQAPAQSGLGGKALEDLVLYALLGARPRALLFEDDLPLAVDLGGWGGRADRALRPGEQGPIPRVARSAVEGCQ